MRWLLLLMLTACVSPIGEEQHLAALDADRDGLRGADDCDPGDPNVNVEAVEWCNGIDDDCDGEIDEADARGVRPFWPDADGDGFGLALSGAVWACEAPAGHAPMDGDCADDDASVYPDARPEVCNGVDDDCNGLVDTEDPDLTDGILLFVDADEDGYGLPGSEVLGCAADPTLADNGDDCDDTDAAVNPGVDEQCNTIDDDCDGTVDEDDAIDVTTWYPDGDGDGAGDDTAGLEVVACDPPPYHVDVGGDCDDADPDRFPTAYDDCDGVDDDCDGVIDSDVTVTTWYGDVDGDGHGGSAFQTESCLPLPGWFASSDDCDDADPDRYPGATETCNGFDDDCDGTPDEAGAVGEVLWYVDGDGDGFGGGAGILACDGAPGEVDLGGDCDDADPAVNPDAEEVCDNLVDNDCDGNPDMGDLDLVDAPVWYLDGDGDGYGGAIESAPSCLAPVGYRAESLDCDDTDPSVAPDQAEVCGDGIDNDCNQVGCGPLGDLAWADGQITLGSDAAGGSHGAALVRGDWNDDGIADVAIGAPGASRVSVFLGPLGPGALGTAEAWAVIQTDPVEQLGAALGSGDLTGDGIPDLVLGAPGAGGGAGAVYVLAGPLPTGLLDPAPTAAATISGSAGEGIGAALVVGQLDGFGAPDLATAAPTAGVGGVVYGFLGPVTGPLATTTPGVQLDGDTGAMAGSALALTGDLDGDGRAELAIGSPGLDTVDLVELAAGPWSLTAASERRLTGQPGTGFGDSLAAAGDLDGDGWDDLVVGAPGAGPTWTGGALYAIPGGWVPLSGSAADQALLTLTSPDGTQGRLVASAGDANDDGLPDVLVGEAPPGQPGSAWLFYGPVSGVLALDADFDARFLPGLAAEGMGTAVRLDDVDGDGVDDAWIGSPLEGPGSEGTATIFLGEGF